MKNNKKDILKEKNNPDYLVPALPEASNEINNYSLISQGNIVNTLNNFTHKNIVATPNGKKEIINGSLKVIFDNNINKLDVISRQFLLTINVFIKKLNITQNDFAIPLSAYMEYRELKDKKETIKTIKKISDILLGIRITGKEKYSQNGEELGFINRRIFYKCEAHNDLILIGIEPDCFKIFTNSPFLGYYNNKILKPNYLNVRTNPHTFNLYSKIQQLKSISTGKDKQHEDIIGVETLIKVTELPPAELIKAQRGSLKHKIIEPFIRDMLKLEDMGILKFEFCKSKGKRLTDEEIEAVENDHNTFINSLVKITWLEYPDTQKIIETKERNKKKIAKRARKKNKLNAEKTPKKEAK